jgi:hypothetical protein
MTKWTNKSTLKYISTEGHGMRCDLSKCSWIQSDDISPSLAAAKILAKIHILHVVQKKVSPSHDACGMWRCCVARWMRPLVVSFITAFHTPAPCQTMIY